MTKDTFLRGNLFVSLALATVLLLLNITTRLITPLKDLAENMKRAERGEKNVRASVCGSKDIKDMKITFNTIRTYANLILRDGFLSC